jgi:hypothetical protein
MPKTQCTPIPTDAEFDDQAMLLPLRQRLARNLRIAIETRDTNAIAIAKRANVDRRTVLRALHAEIVHHATLDALSDALGLPCTTVLVWSEPGQLRKMLADTADHYARSQGPIGIVRTIEKRPPAKPRRRWQFWKRRHSWTA